MPRGSDPCRICSKHRIVPGRERALGLRRQMEGSASFDDFVPAGLASLGIEADEVDLAVMRVAHELYWPAIAGLLEVDLSAVAPEPGADMSRAPESR